MITSRLRREIVEEADLQATINAWTLEDWVVMADMDDAPPRQEFVHLDNVPHAGLAATMSGLSSAGVLEIEYEAGLPEATFLREDVANEDLAAQQTLRAGEGYGNLEVEEGDYGRSVLTGVRLSNRYTVTGYKLFRRYVVKATRLECVKCSANP